MLNNFDIFVRINYLSFKMELMSSEDSNSPTNLDKKVKEALVKNYEELFESEENTDLEIHVNGKIMKVHKTILGAQSKYFAKMFRNEFIESRSGIVNITDFTYDVIKLMVRFLYSGNTIGISSNALELLCAAEKYEIDMLQLICVKKCILTMNAQNVLNYFTTAHKHSFEDLKKAATEFIQRNYAVVSTTDEWKNFEKEHREDMFWKTFESYVSSASPEKRAKYH